MKVVIFNLREDEAGVLNKWKEEHSEIEVLAYTEPLTMENIKLCEGADTVSFNIVTPLEDEVYEELNKMGIRVISQRAAGFDPFNLEKLDELSMKLINVPRYSPYAIGEYVVATALYFTRNLNWFFKNAKEGDFRFQMPLLSKEMRSLTVGIVGTGNIGRETAKLFKGLGANVVGYDLYKSEEAAEILEYVSLDELYKKSDVITLHAPATEENYHMIDTDAISKMKDGVVLINAARGSLVDVKAVLNGLDSKKIKGAAIDVYEFEDGVRNKDRRGEDLDDKVLKEIIDRDDVVYTPHIAFFTENAIDNLVRLALDESIKFIKTGESSSIVNK